MKNKLLKILNTYGVKPQLKYFQSEIYELTEAILEKENENGLDQVIRVVANVGRALSNQERVKDPKDHITEEIADVLVMLEQFRLHYDIDTKDIKKIMDAKIDRQLDRINKDN